jgi:hypothetical protein
MRTSLPLSLSPLSMVALTHVLVPFALEDGGRLGAHAQALLRSFATLAIEKGRHPPLAYRDSSSSAPTIASLRVKRWQQRVST